MQEWEGLAPDCPLLGPLYAVIYNSGQSWCVTRELGGSTWSLHSLLLLLLKEHGRSRKCRLIFFMLFEYNHWQHLKSVTISSLSVRLKKNDIATSGECLYCAISWTKQFQLIGIQVIKCSSSPCESRQERLDTQSSTKWARQMQFQLLLLAIW